MKKFARARRTMGKALMADPGLMLTYRSAVAMCLHDHHGITEFCARNQAARDILGLIFSIPTAGSPEGLAP